MTGNQSWPSRLPFFYGWVVVAVAFITIGISVNLRSSFSLLYPSILHEFGWDRGITAAAFSIGFIFSIALAPMIGLAMDRWGPRLVIPVGVTMVACGFATAWWISSPLELYLSLGMLVIGGSISIGYVGHSMFIPNWFVRKRGLAIGLAFSGVGVGAIVLLPAVQVWIANYGWRTACLILAALSITILVPLNAILQRNRPADLGLKPDGDVDTQVTSAEQVEAIVDTEWTSRDWTVISAMKTNHFWWICLGYFTALFSWYAVLVHQTSYLIDVGFDATQAANALGLVGLFGIGGQIGIGALSDRLGRELSWGIANIGFIICCIALLMLEEHPTQTLLYTMIISQGLLGYGLASVYGAVTADIFSGPRFATIFAFTGLGGSIGAGTGPWISGYLFDITGSYAPAFYLCIVACVISTAAIWMAAPRKVRQITRKTHD